MLSCGFLDLYMVRNSAIMKSKFAPPFPFVNTFRQTKTHLKKNRSTLCASPTHHCVIFLLASSPASIFTQITNASSHTHPRKWNASGGVIKSRQQSSSQIMSQGEELTIIVGGSHLPEGLQRVCDDEMGRQQ